jgi:aminoacyl tRNA synthase complex-interacting multifunctional protein 1
LVLLLMFLGNNAANLSFYFCQVQKKKIWESVQPHLRTTNNCIAVLGEHPMRTSAGLGFCKLLQGARVS